MSHIEGANREQLMIRSLSEMVEETSMVRIIDKYIEAIDLSKLGFTRVEAATTGRPAYAGKALAKLYVYGYENGVRSSRKLNREARINVEVMWLLEGLTPDYKTISEFRRENIRPLQKLFREFVRLCKTWELIGGEIIAVDGTKIKARNNKKSNYSRKKLTERLSRLDEKIEAYLSDLEKSDAEGEDEGGNHEMLEALFSRKELYEGYLRQIDETGANEVSMVDPDARLMGNNRGGVDVSYNVQSAADGKNHLLLAYDVSQNPSDQHQLSGMAKRVKRLGYKRFKLVADKGYYNGADLRRVKRLRVTAIVSKQKPSDPKEQPEAFHTDKFRYDAKSDSYQCPMGHTLHAHSGKDNPRRKFFNKQACAACPHRSDCTHDQRGYRNLTRSEHAAIYEEADRNFRQNLEIYKLRQQIVEHPFGTIKHFMRGSHFLLRTRRKVRCEVALLFLGYNLKRVLKILGFHEFMARLDALSCAVYDFLLSFAALMGEKFSIAC